MEANVINLFFYTFSMGNEFVLTLATAIPVTLAIVQAIKIAKVVSSEFMPLLALLIGTVVGGVMAYATKTDLATGFFYGLLGGSTATAGFATVKNTISGLIKKK